MQLYVSTTSPYARLCMIAAYKASKQDLQLRFVRPWENPANLEAVNPYSQIPVLVQDNGLTLVESVLIMQTLYPQAVQSGRRASLLGQALATINQVVRFVSLRMMGADPVSNAMQARSLAALKKALPRLPILEPLAEDWGNIALGVAYHYVEQRLPEAYTFLSAQNRQAVAQFSQRDFMQKTRTEALEKFPARIADL